MNVHELIHDVSDRLATSGSVKNVYGDAVTVGNRTVIPMASVRYGFGGGGQEERTGGGGGVVARPCGALEITPEGTRFLTFPDYRMIAAAAAIGFLWGVIVSGGTKRRRY